MTAQSRTILQRVISAILAAGLIGLTGVVLTNRDRVTILEAKTRGIETSQDRIEGQMETNRVENREEHREIKVKLDEIAKEIRK